ncbi:MAG: SDR family oxidoreductase [Rikenellaceae bacterium]|nr:SDR family oxidoreductase [Rikenellaceae bacterium]
MDFTGKTVVITGASSGIGLALARCFSAAGANIVAGARSAEKLSALQAEIESKGGKIKVQSTDVTREGDCKALIEGAVETFGGIDVMICNAGISMRALFDDLELSVLHRLMDVNFWGTVYCAKYALPYLQASRGSLVGVSSVAGIHGLPGRTGYSASKYAMTGFLETVRIENLKKGLHVMIACPGFTASNVRFAALTADGSSQGETPRDEGRMMSAEEAAARIIKGVARRKRTVLMDFNGRATAFIKKFAPGLLDKMFYGHMAKEPDSPLK